jgi:cytochrome c
VIPESGRDRVFVLQKQELTELVDRDRDGVCDEYRCISNAWSVSPNFHEFAFGLVEKEGWLYFNLAIAIDPGGKSTKPQKPDRGRTARVEIASGKIEYLARGLRTPNGIGKGPDGEIYLTDNQGDWLPSSKLLHLEPGAFYGSRAALPPDWQETPVTPPVVWLPQNEIGNSPGECGFFAAGPFAGQLAFCDVTYGGIQRVCVETVKGRRQGALFRFTQGLEAGINRMKLLPNGDVFAGGIGSGGNWGQDKKLHYGLQRLRPRADAAAAFEMLAVRAARNGFSIQLTEPLDVGLGSSAEDYEVRRWRYSPTAEYGGPKIDEASVRVRSATVDPAHRERVFLELDEMRAGHVYWLHLGRRLRSAADRALWSTECWYTLNEIPDVESSPAPLAEAPLENALSAAEKGAGWRLLFDGKSLDGWRSAGGGPADTSWSVRDGALVHAGGAGGGDLETHESFVDFELACEWRIAAGGESGVLYLGGEPTSTPAAGALEMQILDNVRHADGRDSITSAGGVFGLIAPLRDATLPAGDWNRARIKKHGAHVEHWLNGVRVCAFELDAPSFTDRLAAAGHAPPEKSGRILLQGRGHAVAFRNLRLQKP